MRARLDSVSSTLAAALRRFVQIEGVQHATLLAAQAFTSLLPFLVIVAAVGPGKGDLADRIVDRMSLSGDAARSVRALFNSSGDVESAVTWFSILLLVITGLSFTRALQRMFQRAYAVEPGRWTQIWRGLAWLAGLAALSVISSPLRDALREVGGLVVALGASTATGFVLWLFTPWVLLGSIAWRRLVPGAMVSAVLGALLTLASGVYVPILMTWSAEKYGLIGIAFSLQSWLLVLSLVIVTGAVVGAVVNERETEALRRVGD